MKVILKWLQFFVLFLLLAACSNQDESDLTITKDQRGPTFERADGQSISLDTYKGQWLVINYWAIWCGPCVKEIPELNALNDESGVTVLGFNFDQTRGETLAKQLEELKVQFPTVLNDPASMFEQPIPSALPATMIVTPNGQFQEWLMGPQTKDSILSKLG